MEQLALFAIPRNHGLEGDNESGSNAPGDRSVGSTRGSQERLDSLDWQPDPPLHIAAFQGNLEQVRELLEAGADIDAPGETWGSAIAAAEASSMDYYRRDILGLLLSQNRPIEIIPGREQASTNERPLSRHRARPTIPELILPPGEPIDRRQGARAPPPPSINLAGLRGGVSRPTPRRRGAISESPDKTREKEANDMKLNVLWLTWKKDGTNGQLTCGYSAIFHGALAKFERV
jgi:hypothetical protein